MSGLMGGHPGLSPCKQKNLNSLNIIEAFIHDGFVTRLTRRVPLVKQELIALPEHLSSPLVFSEVHVTVSLVLCVYFIDHCLSFCPFSFGHCVVCP